MSNRRWCILALRKLNELQGIPVSDHPDHSPKMVAMGDPNRAWSREIRRGNFEERGRVPSFKGDRRNERKDEGRRITLSWHGTRQRFRVRLLMRKSWTVLAGGSHETQGSPYRRVHEHDASKTSTSQAFLIR